MGAALLQKLGIETFIYGLIPKAVYNNRSVFGDDILEITDSLLSARLMALLSVLVSFLLASGYPAQARVFRTRSRRVYPSPVDAGRYTFYEADTYKDYPTNPLKFSRSGGEGGGGEDGDTESIEEKEEEKEEREVIHLRGVMDMFRGEDVAGGNY